MTDVIPFLVPVTSSNVSRVGYDHATCTLYVEFKGHTLKGQKPSVCSLYAYDDVPANMHTDLMAAPSKGNYLNSVIKPAYSYRKLEPLVKEAA